MRRFRELETETEIEYSDPYGCEADVDMEQIEEAEMWARHLEGECEEGCPWD